jgi:hypothetical protein
MFKRRWIWLGRLESDGGFSPAYGNRSITYSDERGSYQFGLEDGFLFPAPFQVADKPRTLSPSELEEMIERVIQCIKSEGHAVQVHPVRPKRFTRPQAERS